MQITPSKGESLKSFKDRLERIFPKGSTVFYSVVGRTQDGKELVTYYRINGERISKCSKVLREAFGYSVDKFGNVITSCPYELPNAMAACLYGSIIGLCVVEV